MQGIRGKGVNFLGLNLLLGSLKLLIYEGFRFIQQALNIPKSISKSEFSIQFILIHLYRFLHTFVVVRNKNEQNTNQKKYSQ